MSQIYTGGNSDRKGWAGSRWEKVDESPDGVAGDVLEGDGTSSKRSQTDYVGKSFDATREFFKSCSRSRSINKAVRNSPFLDMFVKNIGRMIYSVEKSFRKEINSQCGDNETFFHYLGKALNILDEYSDSLSDVSGVMAQEGLVFKALPYGGSQVNRHQMSLQEHGMILENLSKGVESGRLGPMDLIRYESTGSLSERAQYWLGMRK